MANLTITVPEEILKSARRRALEQGTSVNALLRDYLNQLAGTQPAQANAAKRVLELSRTSRSGRGKAKWTRDELYQR
jgi:replicative DNA helicase